jgi:hypothetical protein
MEALVDQMVIRWQQESEAYQVEGISEIEKRKQRAYYNSLIVSLAVMTFVGLFSAFLEQEERKAVLICFDFTVLVLSFIFSYECIAEIFGGVSVLHQQIRIAVVCSIAISLTFSCRFIPHRSGAGIFII